MSEFHLPISGIEPFKNTGGQIEMKIYSYRLYQGDAYEIERTVDKILSCKMFDFVEGGNFSIKHLNTTTCLENFIYVLSKPNLRHKKILLKKWMKM